MEHFAANVAQLAKREGGQEALAAIAEVHQGTVSKWTKGGPAKNMAAVARMAKRAGVTVDDFLNRPIGENPAPTVVAPNVLLMPVALPSEDALAAMFVTMLVGAEKRSPAELARRLAQGLPTGLAQAQGTRPLAPVGEEILPGEAPRPAATPGHEAP